MTDRPILFSAPMVRALLDGTKTQTRRVAKPQSGTRWWQEPLPSGRVGWFTDVWHLHGFTSIMKNDFYPGDRLWVKEGHCFVPATAYRMSEGVQQTINPADPDVAAVYRAGWDRSIPRWRSSIHMPRWASRITLLVTDVRVQRLQDISEADAMAEGVVEDPVKGWHVPGVVHPNPDFPYLSRVYPREMYAALWDTINGSGAWAENPWVVAVSFTVEQRNIDA